MERKREDENIWIEEQVTGAGENVTMMNSVICTRHQLLVLIMAS
jgi:hypothetical protein